MNPRSTAHMIEDFIPSYGNRELVKIFNEIKKDKSKFYLSYPLPKSSGGYRWIDAPQDPLKQIQTDILYNILYKFRPHKCAVGFISDIGVEYGAEQHLGNNVLLNMDLRRFFPSIKARHVQRLIKFISTRFSEIENVNKFYSDDRKILKHILMYKGHTPQGAPTSPAVANLVCLKLDKTLNELAEEEGLTYTRYADDLSFSHPDKDYKIESLIPTISTIVEGEFLEINRKKTRIMRPHQRMSITGVVINEKLSVPRWKWRNFRAKLHNLKMKNEPISKLEYQKLKGYCEWIKNLHPKRGKRFLKELGKIPLQK